MTNAGGVLCVVNSLEGGGAERVFTTVCAELVARFPGRVSLALLDRAEMKYAPPITPVVLDAGGALAASVARLSRLARVERPAVVFSFLTRANCAAIMAARLSGAKCVISERVNTTAHFGGGAKASARSALVRTLYGAADAIVAPSEGVATELARLGVIGRDKLCVIHNPVDLDAIAAAGRRAPEIELPARFFVAVGRLTPNKNMPLLVQALAASDWRDDLVILGEGPERPRLSSLAAELGVADRVHLPGFVSNPHAVMTRASAFVSASNAEGFPNALVEAMALGLPVASTACPSGPAEILARNASLVVPRMVEAPHGVLTPVQNVAAMTRAMNVLAGPEARARLGAAAKARAQDFGARAALDRYAALIARQLEPELGGAPCGSA